MWAVVYRTKLADLIHSLDWRIEIQVEWTDYFEDTRRSASVSGDQRHNQRLKIRTCGILWFEKAIPFRSHKKSSMGIYTRDFSALADRFSFTLRKIITKSKCGSCCQRSGHSSESLVHGESMLSAMKLEPFCHDSTSQILTRSFQFLILWVFDVADS